MGNRGQADGFEMDDLPKLDTVKDNLNEKLKVSKWIFVIFLTSPQFEEARKQFEAELQPIFDNVKRRFMKNSEGSETMAKQVRFAVEDFDPLTNALIAEAERHEGSIQMCQQFIDDPADPFKTVLVPNFQHCLTRIKGLVELKSECGKLWKELQIKLHMGKKGSGEFFRLVDDSLVPPDHVVLKPEVIKKKYITPLFCNPVPPTLEAMKILWDVVDPEARPVKKEDAASKRKKRVPGNRRGIDSSSSHR